MRRAAALLALTLLGAADGGPGSGSICVPVPEWCAPKGAMTVEEYQAYQLAERADAGPPGPGPELTIQIDDREPVPLGQRPVLLDDLPLGEKHWLKLRAGKRMVESFRFSFEERGGPRLWFRHKCFYGSWSLDLRKRADCPGS